MFSQDQKSKINILTSFQLVAVTAYHLDFFPEQWNELICLTLRIMHILLATLSFVQGHTDTIISLVLSEFKKKFSIINRQSTIKEEKVCLFDFQIGLIKNSKICLVNYLDTYVLKYIEIKHF